jgi:hypothetical protein
MNIEELGAEHERYGAGLAEQAILAEPPRPYDHNALIDMFEPLVTKNWEPMGFPPKINRWLAIKLAKGFLTRYSELVIGGGLLRDDGPRTAN